MLRVENLTKRFGGVEAVSEVSFAVGEGAVHAVIGPNGAGKTTLFNLITGIYRPTSGSITLDGDGGRRDSRRRRSPAAASRARSRTFSWPWAFRPSRT